MKEAANSAQFRCPQVVDVLLDYDLSASHPARAKEAWAGPCELRYRPCGILNRDRAAANISSPATIAPLRAIVSSFQTRLPASDPEETIRVVDVMVMLDPEKCRAAAERCRREAERALSPVERERWLKMAAEWAELARQNRTEEG